MSDEKTMDPKERQLSAELNRVLEQEVRELDQVTLSKLSAARHRATAETKDSWIPLKPWVFGTGLASMALLAMIVLPRFSSPVVDQPEVVQLTSSAAVLEDLSILAAGEGVDFYQSVDFLLWLESNTGREG
jgi:hypothetical protein